VSLAFKQLRVYVRGIIVLLIAAAVALVLIYNRGNQAPVWFFGLTNAEKPVNVVWLMVCTAAGALVSWWTFRTAWRLLRDWREVRRLRTVQETEHRLKEREAAVEHREKMLQTKEGPKKPGAEEWE